VPEHTIIIGVIMSEQEDPLIVERRNRSIEKAQLEIEKCNMEMQESAQDKWFKQDRENEEYHKILNTVITI